MVAGERLPLGAPLGGTRYARILVFFEIRKFFEKDDGYSNFKIPIGIWQTAASWSVSWRVAVCALLCDLEK